MRFTDEEVNRANSIDLISFLTLQGEQFKKSGREWRWKVHDSVTIKGNKWYQHSQERGGLTIDFLKTFYECSFVEAVETLLNKKYIPYAPVMTNKREKIMELPKANSNMKRIYGYLIKCRKIDWDVINYFVGTKKLYEDAEFHNAVFVGYDERGKIQYAFKRGTTEKGQQYRGNVENSNPDYSFNHKGISNTLYVFESPIDMMSYITLNKESWKKDSYLSLNGVAENAMLFFLKTNPMIKSVVVCLDNDKAGRDATTRIKNNLEKMGYRVSESVSNLKDWNEDLVNLKTAEEYEMQMGGMV